MHNSESEVEEVANVCMEIAKMCSVVAKKTCLPSSAKLPILFKARCILSRIKSRKLSIKFLSKNC